MSLRFSGFPDYGFYSGPGDQRAAPCSFADYATLGPHTGQMLQSEHVTSTCNSPSQHHPSPDHFKSSGVYARLVFSYCSITCLFLSIRKQLLCYVFLFIWLLTFTLYYLMFMSIQTWHFGAFTSLFGAHFIFNRCWAVTKKKESSVIIYSPYTCSNLL